MKTYYTSTKPVNPEPTTSDLLKALGYIFGLFFIFVVILFGSSFIDYFMNACFK